MSNKEKITCYHYRAVEIPVGQDVPHTRVKDSNVLEELWTIPLVWFTIGEPLGWDPYGADPRYVHRLELNRKDIIIDQKNPEWGLTKGPAIVQEVWSEKNPCVRD